MKKLFVLFVVLGFLQVLSVFSQSSDDIVWLKTIDDLGNPGEMINSIFTPDGKSVLVYGTERFLELDALTGEIIRVITGIAGAKTILMSLWTVSDEATQELMTTFYKEWLSCKTKRDAFQKAQTILKSKYHSPYYWGVFVMVGE